MYFLRSSWLICSTLATLSSRRALCICSCFSLLWSFRSSGWFLMWLLITKAASARSLSSSTSSRTTQSTSNRERIGSLRSTLSGKESCELYLPLFGFAAAITAHRACRLATIPAFEIEMLCCSIASWMLVRSLSFILSNSSIRQMPLSAKTKAPPSSTHSFVLKSRCTEAVNPTAEAPFPVV